MLTNSGFLSSDHQLINNRNPSWVGNPPMKGVSGTLWSLERSPDFPPHTLLLGTLVLCVWGGALPLEGGSLTLRDDDRRNEWVTKANQVGKGPSKGGSELPPLEGYFGSILDVFCVGFVFCVFCFVCFCLVLVVFCVFVYKKSNTHKTQNKPKKQNTHKTQNKHNTKHNDTCR